MLFVLPLRPRRQRAHYGEGTALLAQHLNRTCCLPLALKPVDPFVPDPF